MFKGLLICSYITTWGCTWNIFLIFTSFLYFEVEANLNENEFDNGKLTLLNLH